MSIPTMPTAITAPAEREFKISPFVARPTDDVLLWFKEPHKSRAREILELVGAIYSTPENPRTYGLLAFCVCGHNLKPFEILGGFNLRGVNTIRCPRCDNRVSPFIQCTSGEKVHNLKFWCAESVKAKLPEYRNMKPGEILEKNPALGHSAIVHYGVLSNAFMKCGIRRRSLRLQAHELKRLRPFLGRLPVGIIAGIAGIKVNTVIQMHAEHNIPQCPNNMPPPSD